MRIDVTPLARLALARRHRRLTRGDAVAEQRRQLAGLLKTAAGTQFGREHGFASLKDVADFQRAVPLRNYEQMWTQYWKAAFPVLDNITWPGRVPFFAVSSGTTSGTSKYLPITRDMRRSNVNAAMNVLALHAAAKPRSRFFAGPSFMLGGSTELVREADGVWSGDLSAIAAMTLPRWAQAFAFPPSDLALLTDWDEKLRRTAEASLDKNIRILTGTPSWVLILLERVAALRTARGEPATPYPDLDLFIHGGINFAPYRERFDAFFAGRDVDFREVYPASEGFIGFADRGPGEGLRLNTDGGLFFEFVPVEELGSANPTRHWAATIEPDVNYAVVLTTCSGLFTYVIGDTVRFVDTQTPRLLITGRTSYMLSAFGEHLIGEEIEKAVLAGAAAIGKAVTDFSVGAVFPDATTPLGHHVYVVEFASETSTDARSTFAAALDAALLQMNDDYRAHRGGGHGMADPRVEPMAPGGFAAWMASRGRAGGQNKVPRVINDAGLLADLRDFAAGYRGSSA